MTKSKIKILIASAIFVVVLNIALYTWSQSPKVLKVSYLENVQVDRVAFDKEGRVWVSGEGELRVYKDGNLIQTFTNADIPVLGEYLRELEIDDKGRVWITSQLSEYEAHLAVFDGTKWSTVGVFSNPLGEKPGIKSLAIDTQGRAWVGTVSGLFIIDGESQENYTSYNSDLLGNIVTCISFDDKGRAWIGSWSKTTRAGLNIFDGKNWRSFTAKDSPRFNLRIDAIAFDLQGQTWVEAGGVYVYNGENWTTYEDKSFEETVFNGGLWKKHRFPKARVGDLATDENGNAWIPIYKNGYQAEGVNFIPSDPYPYRSPLENGINSAIDSNGLFYFDIFLLGLWSYFATRMWRRSGLTLADLPEYFASKKKQVKKTLLVMGCLVLGMLAVAPYLVIFLWYFPQWQWISNAVFDSKFGGVVFISGFFAGIPLGIISIILGILSWRQSYPEKMSLLFAIIGILLGIAGILGHIWFFATCQFCQ